MKIELILKKKNLRIVKTAMINVEIANHIVFLSLLALLLVHVMIISVTNFKDKNSRSLD